MSVELNWLNKPEYCLKGEKTQAVLVSQKARTFQNKTSSSFLGHRKLSHTLYHLTLYYSRDHHFMKKYRLRKVKSGAWQLDDKSTLTPNLSLNPGFGITKEAYVGLLTLESLIWRWGHGKCVCPDSARHWRGHIFVTGIWEPFSVLLPPKLTVNPIDSWDSRVKSYI